MRGYSKVSPRIWTGSLGRAIRGDSFLQSLALYCVTSPHSNHIGLYLLPLPYVAADLGFTDTKIKSGLERLEALGYLKYDSANERVWVIAHFRHELGGDGEKKDGDKRLVNVAKLLEDNAVSALARAFADYYGIAYEGEAKPLTSPLDGAFTKEQRAKSKEQRTKTGFAACFSAWVETLPESARKLARPTAKRQAAYQARVAEGYTDEQLLAAATGYVNDPWPERRTNARARDLATLLRDGGQVEKFAAMNNGRVQLRIDDPEDGAGLPMRPDLSKWSAKQRHYIPTAEWEAEHTAASEDEPS